MAGEYDESVDQAPSSSYHQEYAPDIEINGQNLNLLDQTQEEVVDNNTPYGGEMHHIDEGKSIESFKNDEESDFNDRDNGSIRWSQKERPSDPNMTL